MTFFPSSSHIPTGESPSHAAAAAAAVDAAAGAAAGAAAAKDLLQRRLGDFPNTTIRGCMLGGEVFFN